jgi:hypothetical protein
MENLLPLIPEPLQPHFATFAAVLSAAAAGAIAAHIANAWLAFPLTALLAKMAGEQIERRWP